MNFRTIVEIKKPDFQICHTHKITLLGSCFTENIGGLLLQNYFNVDINPFGIIYNPVSVLNSLNHLINNKQFALTELQYANNKWFSYFFHGSFSNPDKEKTLEQINNRMQFSSERLRNSQFLFLTFGTSWVYRHKEMNFVVSNCHKTPETVFERYLLTVDEIFDNYKLLINNILEINPEIKIIFTISPIRHWKDGAHGNQISKSTLLLAIYQLTKIFSNVFYFPSYEIVMDELRDYRFYADDMLHISNLAVEYIWERFSDTFFSEKTKSITKEILPLKLALQHKIVDSESEESKIFKTKIIKTVENIACKYPEIDFSGIRNRFEA
jgi:hypothetical protein